MMTFDQATKAARTLREAGQFEAAEHMEHAADTARKQHFQDMQQRCWDNPDFASAYEEDCREFRSPEPASEW